MATSGPPRPALSELEQRPLTGRDLALLLVLGASDPVTHGRRGQDITSLMKLLFLATIQVGFAGEVMFRFHAHIYGPFCAELYEAIERLRGEYIEVRPTGRPDYYQTRELAELARTGSL